MAYGGGFEAGASQFAGGGFMPSPAGGRNDTMFGNGSGAQTKKSSGKSTDTVRAVTIRHLLRETESQQGDTFMVDGHELGTVTLVGKVVSFQQQHTQGMLVLDDSTGPKMNVSVWRNDDQDHAGQWLQPGLYVRVYGTLKVFNKQKSLTAYAVKRIDDHNEVVHHNLKCIFEQMHLMQGPPPQAGSMQAKPTQPAAGQMAYTNTGAYGGAAATQGAYGGPAAAGGNDIRQDVCNFFNRPDILALQNGASVDDCVRALQAAGRNYARQQVMEACDFLHNEGHMYTTNDDQHFKGSGC